MKQWCLNMMQPFQYHKQPRENVKFIAVPGFKLNVSGGKQQKITGA